jgi:hypothetical protein
MKRKQLIFIVLAVMILTGTLVVSFASTYTTTRSGGIDWISGYYSTTSKAVWASSNGTYQGMDSWWITQKPDNAWNILYTILHNRTEVVDNYNVRYYFQPRVYRTIPQTYEYGPVYFILHKSSGQMSIE